MSQNLMDLAQKQEFKLSNGQTMCLPFHFTVSGFSANFTIPTAKAKELLPAQLEPAEIIPGQSVISLQASKMQHEETGPYTRMPAHYELDVCMPVLHQPGSNPLLLPLLVPERFKNFGFYLLKVPVSTPEAEMVGKEIYGFPTIMAEIEAEDVGEFGIWQIKAGGLDLLTLRVKKMSLKPKKHLVRYFTQKDGNLLITSSQWEGFFGTHVASTGLLELGNHPVGQELRNLGLNQRATSTMWVEGARGVFGIPGDKSPL